MGFYYLDDIATADIAFRAEADTIEGVFLFSAQALLDSMVAETGSIKAKTARNINIKQDALDMLLFDFLQQLIYFKDAENLLLSVNDLKIEKNNKSYQLSALAKGEKISPERHQLKADVKAVTLHKFQVSQTDSGWYAQVILDI